MSKLLVNKTKNEIDSLLEKANKDKTKIIGEYTIFYNRTDFDVGFKELYHKYIVLPHAFENYKNQKNSRYHKLSYKKCRIYTLFKKSTNYKDVLDDVVKHDKFIDDVIAINKLIDELNSAHIIKFFMKERTFNKSLYISKSDGGISMRVNSFQVVKANRTRYKVRYTLNNYWSPKEKKYVNNLLVEKDYNQKELSYILNDIIERDDITRQLFDKFTKLETINEL